MTTMTKARRREILTLWRLNMMLWDARRELVRSALEFALGRIEPESELLVLVSEQQDQYTKAIAELVGDASGWLNWYARDNDYGRKGYEACARKGDKPRPIRTVAQLARLIEVDA